MTCKILISAPYFQPIVEDYRFIFDRFNIELVVPVVTERLSEEELVEIIEDIDGVIAGDDRFTEKVFLKARKLKVLSKWGTGIDSFDLEAAKGHGVVVTNTPGAFNEPVADHVWGFILAFARKIPWQTAKIKEGAWVKPLCISMSDRTLGVIGVGNIGKNVIRRAAGFGTAILGNDIKEIDPVFIEKQNVTMVSRDELLQRSDFVSLNCDLNETSRHIIGGQELAMMGRATYLINTARGPLIDEKALVFALERKLIAGVGLDVYEHEPISKDHPLCRFDNVLLTPHNSNSSAVHWNFVHKNTVRQLLKHLGFEIALEELPDVK